MNNNDWLGDGDGDSYDGDDGDNGNDNNNGDDGSHKISIIEDNDCNTNYEKLTW